MVSYNKNNYEPAKLATNLFVLLVLEGQQWLFEGTSEVRVGGGSLEVGGCKLGKPILCQVLFRIRYGNGGQSCQEWGNDSMKE